MPELKYSMRNNVPLYREEILKQTGRLGARLQAKLPITAEQQTKLSWARAVRTWSEVPEAYRDSLKAVFGDTTVFPYTVLIPSHKGYAAGTKEKLICCLDRLVCVLETVNDAVVSFCYPVEHISHVQMGSALLQSWLRIWGTTSDGIQNSSEFKFNSITNFLFTPIVKGMRPVECIAEVDHSQECSMFDDFGQINFKLMNFGRRSILPGERVVQTILQPEIRTETARFLGHPIYSTLGAPHISILTDTELILVQDGIGKRWGRSVVYGGVWDYIPLDKIASILLTETSGTVFTMSVSIQGEDRVDCLFESSNCQKVGMLQNRIYASR